MKLHMCIATLLFVSSGFAADPATTGMQDKKDETKRIAKEKAQKHFNIIFVEKPVEERAARLAQLFRAHAEGGNSLQLIAFAQITKESDDINKMKLLRKSVDEALAWAKTKKQALASQASRTRDELVKLNKLIKSVGTLEYLQSALFQ